MRKGMLLLLAALAWAGPENEIAALPDDASSVGKLAAALESKEPAVRRLAATKLGRIGAPAKRAVQPLVLRLLDSEEPVRDAARDALLALYGEKQVAKWLASPDYFGKFAGGLMVIALKARGKKYADKVLRLVDDPDEQISLVAYNAILKLGKGSIPALRRAMRKRKSAPVALTMALALGDMASPLKKIAVRLRTSKDPATRIRAMALCYRFAPEIEMRMELGGALASNDSDEAFEAANVALQLRADRPELFAQVEKSVTRGGGAVSAGQVRVARVVAEHGSAGAKKAAFARIVTALRGDDARATGMAMLVLKELGEHSLPVVAKLIAAKDARDRLRGCSVAEVLPPKIAAPLEKQLWKVAMWDPDTVVRETARAALAKIAPRRDAARAVASVIRSWSVHRNTVSHLVRTLDDPSPLVRLVVLAKLKEIGLDARSAMPDVIKRLGEPVPGVRRQVVKLLVGMGLRVAKYVVVELEAEDGDVADGALEVLVELGELAADVTPQLVKLLGHANDDVVWRAQDALAATGAGCLRAMEGQLDGDRWYPCVWVLGQVGPPAKKFLPALRSKLGFAPWDKKPRIAYAVWRISGKKDAAAFGVLLEALASENEKAVLGAAHYLGESERADALPALRKRAASVKTMGAKVSLGIALLELGTDEDAAIARPFILAAFRGADEELAEESMYGLALLGDSGVAACLGLLQHKKARMRIRACRALAVTEAVKARPVLVQTARFDRDDDVRAAAKRALAIVTDIAARNNPFVGRGNRAVGIGGGGKASNRDDG